MRPCDGGKQGGGGARASRLLGTNVGSFLHTRTPRVALFIVTACVSFCIFHHPTSLTFALFLSSSQVSPQY